MRAWRRASIRAPATPFSPEPPHIAGHPVRRRKLVQPARLPRRVGAAGMSPHIEQRVAEGVLGGEDALGAPTKDHADHEWGRSGP